MPAKEKLQPILDTLPTKPGCYLMKNAEGTIIYVGKAINLRNRVRSYFHASANHSGKTRELVRRIDHIEWIVQPSELEALLLEYNLIQKHKPRYNVRWKDGKRYPYIKVTWKDDFPKVHVSRRMVQDGSRYFGPYTSAWAVHQTLDILRKAFPYLTCDRVITGQDERACLYHDIKLCNGPCIGVTKKAEYRAMIQDLCDFLHGRTDHIIKDIQRKMEAAAESLQFERAAALRDQMVALQRVVEKQRVVGGTQTDSDVIAFARDRNDACVQVFFIRGGKLIGRNYFVMEGAAEEDDDQVMSAFVKQFYHEASNVPPEVLLPNEIAEGQIIEEWLKDQRGGKKVSLHVPQRGKKRDLVNMASENATEILSTLRAQWDADTHKQETALAELQKAFNMDTPPGRLECYDVSNTQGTNSYASMVVFHQGVPSKKDYRRFKIKTVVGPNDFESMREALTRRFRRWQDALAKRDELGPGEKIDESFARLPELLIVDGGKGQMGVAYEVLQEFHLTDRIVLAGLAKQHEELFIPNHKRPIMLPRRSQALFLVQRIRDEAHRFALAAHRKERSKQGLASQLDGIPGIGPSRRKSLLKKFGSIDGIRNATMTELLQTPGMNKKSAASIKEHL